jgi:uncharacterized protein (DUF488 family)
MNRPLVLTIGHSNRALDAFLDLLAANDVACVLDVRTLPRSRHNPQFNIDTLPASLAERAIAYRHVPELGGLRHARADSPNRGWQNASFRGFADYMQTPDFAANVAWVAQLASRQRCALMCAEAVPWRCHRSLIADALLLRKVRVEHIIGAGRRKEHVLTPFACVQGEQLSYPAPAQTDPSR